MLDLLLSFSEPSSWIEVASLAIYVAAGCFIVWVLFK